MLMHCNSLQANALPLRTLRARQGDADVGDASLRQVTPAGVEAAGPVGLLLLADIAAASRLWGYGRFVLTRYAARRIAGLRFHKMLGSGFEGGFGLKPSISRQGLFCVFDRDADVDRFIESPLMQAYRRHARELFWVRLRAFSCKGSWAGQSVGLSAQAPVEGPIAALTRASIRPAAVAKFWRMQPGAEAALANAKGCLLTVGVGEAPVFRQATFTMWDSAAAMDAYARTGAHLEAIRAAHQGRFFSESMFARFVPYDARGVYKAVRYG
jgi:heme-degrading monooxygenase HmoA